MLYMKRQVRHLPLILLIAIFFVWSVFPVAWMFLTSLKPPHLTFRSTVFIFRPTLENYRLLFSQDVFLPYLANTTIVASTTTLLSIVFGSLAAYSFTRFRFPGSTSLPLVYLVMRMVPRIVLVVPYFMLLRQLGLLNTHAGLFVAYTSFALPFVIWMMIGFFKEIPVDLEEAGLIDGCNRLTVLRHVVVPLAAPGLIATAIFTFLLGWNEFLFALILSGADTRTLPIMIAGFQTDRGDQWGLMSAAGTLILLPVVILALSMQRYIIRGMTMGAVKG